MHIYLRTDQIAVWRLEWTVGHSAMRSEDFASEANARAAAEGIIEAHPGHWLRLPPTPGALPRAEPS